jgi:hypothetical protein
MANKKITQLNVNTNPTVDDVFPIVNSGETKQLSLSGLTSYLQPFFSGSTPTEFTGGTVTGTTTFTNGVITDTISATTYNNLPISAVDAGFSVTANTSAGLGGNVILPQNSTVTYPNPLITNGYTVTVPASTTLTII